MTDPAQNPVNALYGFSRFLGDFLEEMQPEFVAVAFDENRGDTCVRTAIYPEYKANREPAPPELKLQFERCRAVTRALGLADCADQCFEADDLIAAMAAQMRGAGHKVTILSRDKDLAQVLQPGDVLWDYPSGRRCSYDQVPEVYGVRAEQIADFLALTGDSVDNIRGVRGVGPKTASALLQKFDTVDAIYENLDDVARMDIRAAVSLPGKLRDHRARRGPRTAAHPGALRRARDRGRAITRAPARPISTASTRSTTLAGFGDALRRQAKRLAAP